MSDVFISYSRKDSEFVRRLNDALVKVNLKIWVDWEDIARGEDWWSAIQEGVEKADTALIVISENWLTSEVCHRELEYVRQHEKRVFPIIRQQIRGEVELRSKGSWIDQNWEMRARDNWKYLRSLNWTTFDDDSQFEASFAALLKAIEEDQPYIKAHTRYQTRGLEWERSKRNPGFLLVGDDLTFAQKWLVDSEKLQPPATDLVRTYIDLSKAAEEARQRREALREQSVKQFRRAAIGLVGVVILTIIIAIYTGLSAYKNQNDARNALAQLDTASVAFSTATGVAIQAVTDSYQQDGTATEAARQAATLKAENDDIQKTMQSVQAQVTINSGTLTAIPPQQTRAAEVADIYLQLARGLLQVEDKAVDQDRAQLAVNTADQIMKDHPYEPFAFIASAIIKERAGYIEQAMEIYGLAIALFPDYPQAYMSRAAKYDQQENWSSAINDYSAIIQINENSGYRDPYYYDRRGIDYYQLSDYQNALRDFDTAISLQSDDVDAYYYRGLTYHELSNYAKAVINFDKVISLQPAAYLDAYVYRAYAYNEQGDLEAAMADYWMWVQLNRTPPQVATTIHAGETPITTTILMKSDFDYRLPFEGMAGQIVQAEADRIAGAQVDPLLIILDPKGHPIVFNDDVATDNLNSAITNFPLPANGTYTLVVSYSISGSEGDIRVTLDLTTPS